MSLNLNTLENIRRGHQQKRIDLEGKISQCCTLKKKGFLRNQKRIFPWIHGKILFWFRRKKVSFKTFFEHVE